MADFQPVKITLAIDDSSIRKLQDSIAKSITSKPEKKSSALSVGTGAAIGTAIGSMLGQIVSFLSDLPVIAGVLKLLKAAFFVLLWPLLKGLKPIFEGLRDTFNKVLKFFENLGSGNIGAALGDLGGIIGIIAKTIFDTLTSPAALASLGALLLGYFAAKAIGSAIMGFIAKAIGMEVVASAGGSTIASIVAGIGGWAVVGTAIVAAIAGVIAWNVGKNAGEIAEKTAKASYSKGEYSQQTSVNYNQAGYNSSIAPTTFDPNNPMAQKIVREVITGKKEEIVTTEENTDATEDNTDATNGATSEVVKFAEMVKASGASLGLMSQEMITTAQGVSFMKSTLVDSVGAIQTKMTEISTKEAALAASFASYAAGVRSSSSSTMVKNTGKGGNWVGAWTPAGTSLAGGWTASGFSGSASQKSAQMSTKASYNDMIWRPGEGPVSISPSDTLIATKDTGKLGGGGSTIHINIDRPMLLDNQAMNELVKQIGFKLQSEMRRVNSYV